MLSNHKHLRALPVFIVITFIIGGCNFGLPTPQQEADRGALFTQAAATLWVQLTQIASQATVTPPPLESPTSAPETQAVITPAIITGLPPTSTPLPTATPFTPVAPVFPTSIPSPAGVCLQAKFVKDVTIPDGTKLNAGDEFTKTWELLNAGTCAWSLDFSIVFSDGDQLGGPDSVDLDEQVSPGESVRISVDLIAPYVPGDYRGEWMLADESGDEFGLGLSGLSPFWVDIEVKTVKSGTVISFVDAYCSAEWTSSAGDLPCPGSKDDKDGFVIRLANPKQENRNEDEPALWTNPEMADDGWIKGIFPAIEIEDGDRFLADVGCLAGYEKCNVAFELKYIGEGGKEKSLGVWKEEYDGEITHLDVDLSDLSGKEIRFVLKVTTNGAYREDAAFWLLPHITRD